MDFAIENYLDIEANENIVENYAIYANATPKIIRQLENYVECEHFEAEEAWQNWMIEENDMWTNIK